MHLLLALDDSAKFMPPKVTTQQYDSKWQQIAPFHSVYFIKIKIRIYKLFFHDFPETIHSSFHYPPCKHDFHLSLSLHSLPSPSLVHEFFKGMICDARLRH